VHAVVAVVSATQGQFVLPPTDYPVRLIGWGRFPGLGRADRESSPAPYRPAHEVLAFYFNVVVLALTINIIAGLI
jgi:hypothetical protein